MRHLVIEGGKVRNVIEAPEGFTLEEKIVLPHETAQIGWLYDGETITPPPPEPDPVPAAVSMRQARLALSRNGLLANAEGAIAAMTGPEGDEARIEWEYATELRRAHPLVVALGATLGLDDAATDDLFRQAVQIL
ncbi:hypothetical protein [Sulfitobacter sp. MOLA879]|uniref:hypothetical protein n=1 Tax=Sulfitobacter sp. MOLA879 TaxID=3368579 RepID=UPI0037465159